MPDHSHATRRVARENFNIAGHLGKVRLFMNAMGFASVPHESDQMAVVLTACPFTEPGAPDDLALELRRGIVERVFERTATGTASWSVEVDPIDPLRLTVFLRPLDEPNPKRCRRRCISSVGPLRRPAATCASWRPRRRPRPSASWLRT